MPKAVPIWIEAVRNESFIMPAPRESSLVYGGDPASPDVLQFSGSEGPAFIQSTISIKSEEQRAAAWFAASKQAPAQFRLLFDETVRRAYQIMGVFVYGTPSFKFECDPCKARAILSFRGHGAADWTRNLVFHDPTKLHEAVEHVVMMGGNSALTLSLKKTVRTWLLNTGCRSYIHALDAMVKDLQQLPEYRQIERVAPQLFVSKALRSVLDETRHRLDRRALAVMKDHYNAGSWQNYATSLEFLTRVTRARKAYGGLAPIFYPETFLTQSYNQTGVDGMQEGMLPPLQQSERAMSMLKQMYPRYLTEWLRAAQSASAHIPQHVLASFPAFNGDQLAGRIAGLVLKQCADHEPPFLPSPVMIKRSEFMRSILLGATGAKTGEEYVARAVQIGFNLSAFMLAYDRSPQRRANKTRASLDKRTADFALENEALLDLNISGPRITALLGMHLSSEAFAASRRHFVRATERALEKLLPDINVDGTAYRLRPTTQRVAANDHASTSPWRLFSLTRPVREFSAFPVQVLFVNGQPAAQFVDTEKADDLLYEFPPDSVRKQVEAAIARFQSTDPVLFALATSTHMRAASEHLQTLRGQVPPRRAFSWWKCLLLSLQETAQVPVVTNRLKNLVPLLLNSMQDPFVLAEGKRSILDLAAPALSSGKRVDVWTLLVDELAARTIPRGFLERSMDQVMDLYQPEMLLAMLRQGATMTDVQRDALTNWPADRRSAELAAAATAAVMRWQIGDETAPTATRHERPRVVDVL